MRHGDTHGVQATIDVEELAHAPLRVDDGRA